MFPSAPPDSAFEAGKVQEKPRVKALVVRGNKTTHTGSEWGFAELQPCVI